MIDVKQARTLAGLEPLQSDTVLESLEAPLGRREDGTPAEAQDLLDNSTDAAPGGAA